MDIQLSKHKEKLLTVWCVFGFMLYLLSLAFSATNNIEQV